MFFPTNGSGRPYVRIDGRTGAFALSVPDGAPEIVEMKGKVLDIDLAGAEQGWLKLDPNGADWRPLGRRDAWDDPPRPSPDHTAGVRVDLMCETWSEPRVRQLRGSSRAITGLIARVAQVAGEVPDGKAVRVKITGSRVVKIGKGTSAEINFEVAPKDRWPDVAAFKPHRKPDAPTNGAAETFGDMKDSALGGPAAEPLDEWE